MRAKRRRRCCIRSTNLHIGNGRRPLGLNQTFRVSSLAELARFGRCVRILKYLNRDYSKSELMAYVGNIRQIIGAERLQLAEGNADGARLIRVYNGSGMEFFLVESRCLDMLSMTYKGIPMNFLSKNGLFYPLRYLPTGAEDTLKHLTGGMFYTCGTANVGWECVDEGRAQVNHGRIKAMSATNVAVQGRWTADDYEIEISGEIRETSLFDENISLWRTIRTSLGKPVVHIRDEIENESFTIQPFMYMYHLNLGFPFIDKDTQVLTSPAEISVRGPETECFIPQYRQMDAPETPGREICLMHAFHKKGIVVNGAVNRRLGLGFYIRQNTEVMPFLHQWKTNIAGTYAMGMEPANCHCEGRVREREVYQSLRSLKPFEKTVVEIELGILEGSAELDAFEASMSRIDAEGKR